MEVIIFEKGKVTPKHIPSKPIDEGDMACGLISETVCLLFSIFV